ncbi:hypothetical protein C3B55_00158 [Candidatus Pseudomonas adelgestsugas]|uniref:Uncharacterized protein n=1 Tax=Candidatus Pseudomonas adelgestsugas TaxID=1302376 RepID=A0ABX5R838_9PSED|nr:hypothetical protein C3B55_00158 [Candidatus Pseudomonas adelgestsugas]
MSHGSYAIVGATFIPKCWIPIIQLLTYISESELIDYGYALFVLIIMWRTCRVAFCLLAGRLSGEAALIKISNVMIAKLHTCQYRITHSANYASYSWLCT